MARRLRFPAVALLILLLAAPAGADLHQRQHDAQSKLSDVESKIAAARRQEAALEGQIASVTQRMRTLEAKVGDVSTRLSALQRDLDLHQQRVRKVSELYRLQTSQLIFLRDQSRLASHRLNARLVAIYESNQPSTVELILGAKSLSQAIDGLDYAAQIADQDKQIATDVATARSRLSRARQKTYVVRNSLAAETRVVAYRVQQVTSVENALLAAHSQLSGARADTQQALANAQSNEHDWVAEANALRNESAQLQAQIAAAQAAPTATLPTAPPTTQTGTPPPSSQPSLIWPVSGPITSPFGMRWGSLHPGIDIGASTGTPIHAAAAGQVLLAGYDGGYGNLVVLDNGGGLSTAYAHQSQIAVSVGQQVTQGQVIGYVGSTGFSTGPHLHFEVRINGAPVDPMGYL